MVVPSILMFISGAAALAFETVWLRMLGRAFGVSVYAMSALTALYMGGLVLGSAAAARWTSRPQDLGGKKWLGVYALLEALACAASLAGTYAMARLPSVVAAFGDGDRPDLLFDTLLRLALASPPLLLPTFFLGATLPVLSQAFVRREEGVTSGVGCLYGANTLGAAAGTLLAAFWTIGAWGETATALGAGALDLLAAILALGLSRRPAPASAQAAKSALSAEHTSEGRSPAPQQDRSAGLVAWLFALSGFSALGFEVLWSRQLIPLLGNSVYAFGLLLSAYLGGTALGSAFSSRRRASFEPWLEFGRLELALSAAALLSLWTYGRLALASPGPDFLYSPLRAARDIPILALKSFLIVLPASFIMGMLFPTAARISSSDGAAGPGVGRIYAFNTAGGILGALWAGFGGIPIFGAHRSFFLLAWLNSLVGILALTLARRWEIASRGRALKPMAFAPEAALCLLAAMLGALSWKDPALDILRPRLAAALPGSSVLFHDESPAGTATGVAMGSDRYLLINGILTAGVGINGTLMAALPNLMLAEPRSTLVICLGAGATLRAAHRLGGEVAVVELVGAVARHLPDFQPDLAGVFQQPLRRLVVEDGRNHLLRSRLRYDSIIVDASPPLYSAGTANLYSREFLALAHVRLTEEGVFTLWLPLYSFEEDYWRILRGFCDEFPHVAVWNHPRVRGILLFGSGRPFAWKAGELDRRIRERWQGKVIDGMSERDVREGFQLGEEEARAYASRFSAVTDDKPFTEFPLRRLLRKEPLQKSHDFLLKAKRPASRETP